jgi:hypothetical protein
MMSEGYGLLALSLMAITSELLESGLWNFELKQTVTISKKSMRNCFLYVNLY